MSIPTALATVTVTLQRLLSHVTTDVTTMTPSAARNGRKGGQLNIFLYGVHCDPALTNSSMPGLRLRREAEYQPLLLALKFLITAYGEDDDDIAGQQLMGHVMSVLLCHPVLDKSAIEGVTQNSNLQNQIQRIRITPDTLAPDDIFRLWRTFQPAEYRLSIGCEISAVLPDRPRSDSTPLAESNYGANNHGTDVVARPPTSDSRDFVQKLKIKPDVAVTPVSQPSANISSSARSELSQNDDLIEVQSRTSPKSAQLERFMQKIETKALWDDLVLPTEQMALLKQIADQIALRDRVYKDWGFRERITRTLGINALFAGESGTGKTLAAEVIANALDFDLYRIDLATVVSKYIGETEKNLGRLFDAAQDSEFILFFDEADALFGQRSEVKGSHDRYANIEVSYLLQRMECYRGLAILATNLKSRMDAAFLRRLRFIVDFPRPDATLREEIWRRVFPRKTPLHSDLNYQRLAELELTGGSIQNVALEAAFSAAQQGSPVTMRLVLAAAHTELQRLER